ncbi:hypothetical protein [Nocardia sp. NPDC004711]
MIVERLDLDYSQAIEVLLSRLRQIGADELADMVTKRVIDHVLRDRPRYASSLLEALGAASTPLLARVKQLLPAAGLFPLFTEFDNNRRRYRFGRDHNGRPARRWDWNDLQ